jgi:X-X-X-Leu-X-X-Gly heptad repeat protein
MALAAPAETPTIAAGSNTIAAGSNTIAAGSNTIAAGSNTIAAGSNTIAAGSNPLSGPLAYASPAASAASVGVVHSQGAPASSHGGAWRRSSSLGDVVGASSSHDHTCADGSPG